MRMSPPQKTAAKEITSGYTIRLNEFDTLGWAHNPLSRWPCSQLAGHRVCVVVDSNGLCDLYLDSRSSHDLDCEISSDELIACIADFLPKKYRQFWPTWDNP